MNMTPEELQKALEKAKRDAEEMLAKMTPEEREQAEIKAKKLIEEDQARMREMIEKAKEVGAGAPSGEKPKVCPSCGAPAGSGNFCTYCGSPLLKQ